jgi:hypothetical protein
MSVASLPCVDEYTNIDLKTLQFSELIQKNKPVILKGAFQDKPLVKAGLKSVESAMAHIKQFDKGLLFTNYILEASHGGRLFYNDDLTGFNFTTQKMALDMVFEQLLKAQKDPKPSSCYIGSTDLATFLPGLLETDQMLLSDHVFDAYPPLASIWMGNRTTVAPHFDMSNNIAVCMAGRRRFTLFPPEQISNLYPGPLFPTPGGQVISMVNMANPDFEKYPKFKAALKSAQVANLEPGDMLLYPAMWWHQVDALDDFNVLINYWWNEVPKFVDTPMDTILHGLLSLRDRPDKEKQAWKSIFDYYLFDSQEGAHNHLPERSQGPLGKLDDMSARRLRALVLNRINR